MIILLQNVFPLCCEHESQDAHPRMDGNHEAHIPLSSNPMLWFAMVLQNSRVLSYSLEETSRLTS